MKILILISTFLFLLSSCKEDSNPVKIDPPNPFAQKEIDWPSLKKSPWPMYRHDPQLTGRSQFPGPSIGILNGAIPAENEMASVVIDNDSIVYIHSSAIYTLSSRKYNGDLRWGKYMFQNSDTYCSPILTSMGYLYYVNPRTVAGVYYDSTTYWKTSQLPYIPMISPGMDKEGNLYLVEYSQKKLYVLKADGAVAWQLSDSDFGTGLETISFSPDGKQLYVRGVTVVAIDISTQRVIWKFKGIWSSSSLIIDNQGNTYFFASTDSLNTGKRKLTSLYSIHHDGTLRWKYDNFTTKYSDGLYYNELTIDWDGNIYAATDTLFSFTNDGKLRWQFGFESGERSITGLTCDRNSTVFVLTDKNNVYAVDKNGFLRWKTNVPLLTSFGLSPSITEGKLFIPTWNSDKKVFIIE